jgi:hypothetical protein
VESNGPFKAPSSKDQKRLKFVAKRLGQSIPLLQKSETKITPKEVTICALKSNLKNTGTWKMNLTTEINLKNLRLQNEEGLL